MDNTTRSVVLVAALLVAAAVPAVGTVAAASADTSADADAQFDEPVIEVAVNETAEIPVSVSNASAAVVQVGSEEVNYVATVVLSDGNDDGAVTLHYNTSKAGHDGGFAVNASADNVTVENETAFDAAQRLDSGSYDLRVAPGNDTSAVGDNETDVATLSVTESSEESSENSSDTNTTAPSGDQYEGHVDDIENGVVLASAQNQTITGDVDLEPGTELTVETRKSGKFLKTQQVNVTDDGRFRASFDFSDLADGTEFEIRLRANGTVQDELTGVLRTPPTTETTTTQTSTATQTATSTATTQTSTTEGAMQDETTTSTTTSSQGTVPGFGLTTGALAVAALAGVALVARRKNA